MLSVFFTDLGGSAVFSNVPYLCTLFENNHIADTNQEKYKKGNYIACKVFIKQSYLTP